MKPILSPAAILLGLAACSPQPADGPDPSPGAANGTAPPAAGGAAPPPRPAAPAEAEPAADLLTLEGLGALRIGRAVPAGSGWAERGVQISESCRTVSSPAHPGIYAIVEDGKVRRITVGQGATVRLAEGVGPGSAEAEARSAFPGLREEPHKYADSPAKYLTAPNAASGDPALRFEIGADRKVSLVHVGAGRVLFYVEGCA